MMQCPGRCGMCLTAHPHKHDKNCEKPCGYQQGRRTGLICAKIGSPRAAIALPPGKDDVPMLLEFYINPELNKSFIRVTKHYILVPQLVLGTPTEEYVETILNVEVSVHDIARAIEWIREQYEEMIK